MSDFKIGDKVVVVGSGWTCSTYEEFIRSCAHEYMSQYQRGYSPDDGDVGVVVGYGMNPRYHEMFYAVLSNNKTFCIGNLGLILSPDTNKEGNNA